MSATCERPVVPMDWTLRVDGALSASDNMRIDEEILAAQKDPAAAPAVRIFLWRAPAVSFGRLQDPAAAAAFARDGGASECVRRPTGGGMVLHRGDVSFSVAWRRDHAGFPKCLGDIYRAIHETAARALGDCGINATFFSKAGPAAAAGICFAEPVKDDVMGRDGKVVGGALRVTGWGRLYQGNILSEKVGAPPEELARRLAEAFEKSFFRRPPLSCHCEERGDEAISVAKDFSALKAG
jgi:lipoate-protein ligase A